MTFDIEEMVCLVMYFYKMTLQDVRAMPVYAFFKLIDTIPKINDLFYGSSKENVTEEHEKQAVFMGIRS